MTRQAFNPLSAPTLMVGAGALLFAAQVLGPRPGAETGLVLPHTVRLGSGTIYFQDATSFISRQITNNTLQFAASGSASQMSVSAAAFNLTLGSAGFVNLGSASNGGAASNQTINAVARGGNTGPGINLKVCAGTGSLSATPTVGGALDLQGGAGGTNQNGGPVNVCGGAKNGAGADGNVNLGFNGSATQGRVRVRNSAFYLHGYVESAGAPSATEFPLDGDLGVHKNTSTGAFALVYNAGGTIKSVALT
jgi:hypothetical protein